jgi:putative DNA primase/helicase
LGKTGAAMVTGSIWGCHRSPARRENGFAESWSTTAGKVEITALAHNETVMILNDTKRAARNDKDKCSAVIDMSFGLAEHVEKERLTNTTSIRGWLLYFLSTSNFSLDELAHRAGVEVDDAERGRLVDIPYPNAGHGIYEHLHRFADGEKFTDALKIRCRKYCGAVGQEFVKRVVRDRRRDSTGLKQFLKQERNAYLKAIKAQADAANLHPLNRASGRFATVFAAGCLAIRYELFQWDRQQLLQAILSCQLDGLNSAPAKILSADSSGSSLRAKLVGYFIEKRRKFLDLDESKPVNRRPTLDADSQSRGFGPFGKLLGSRPGLPW